jgi:hypothetical protein
MAIDDNASEWPWIARRSEPARTDHRFAEPSRAKPKDSAYPVLNQLIKPVVLSKVKLGWVPFGVAAFKVKLDGELTLIVKVTPLVFL